MFWQRCSHAFAQSVRYRHGICRFRHSRAERDLRAQETRRKISSGTRSNKGRDSREACLSLLKTCNKINVSFWDYLGSRFQVPDAPEVPRLATLVVQNTGPLSASAERTATPDNLLRRSRKREDSRSRGTVIPCSGQIGSMCLV